MIAELQAAGNPQGRFAWRRPARRRSNRRLDDTGLRIRPDVRCAGIQHTAPLAKITGEVWNDILAVNLSLAFLHAPCLAADGKPLRPRDPADASTVLASRGLCHAGALSSHDQGGLVACRRSRSPPNMPTGAAPQRRRHHQLHLPLRANCSWTAGLSVRVEGVCQPPLTQMLAEKQPSHRLPLPQSARWRCWHLRPGAQHHGTAISDRRQLDWLTMPAGCAVLRYAPPLRRFAARLRSYRSAMRVSNGRRLRCQARTTRTRSPSAPHAGQVNVCSMVTGGECLISAWNFCST